MGKSLRFFYLYGNEAEKFQFYKIPKTLIVNDYFSSVSTDAKLLYALFLDRAALSRSNNWIDSEGRVYIHYSTEMIMADIHCANGKVSKLKKELSDIGLIEIKRMGQGRPDRIYVKNFEPILIENQESHFLTCENRISKDANIESQDMRISHANKNNNNQTENNKTESSSDDKNYHLNLIMKNIDIDGLKELFHSEKEIRILDAVTKAIQNVVIDKRDIGSKSCRIKSIEAENAYLILRKVHISDLIKRIEPNINSIADLVSYVEVALYRESQDKPANTSNPRNSFASSNERHYSKEDYDAMSRDIEL